MLCCGILVNDNTWALVDSITSKIEYYFGANKNEFEEYKMGVEQSASDKNVTLTLKEAMLEDGEFILNINMDFSKKELDKNDMITNYMPQIKAIYIDGRNFYRVQLCKHLGLARKKI